MLNYFRPKPGRFGTMPVVVSGYWDGNIGSSGDTVVTIGSYPQRARINGFSFAFPDLATSGSAVTIVLQKYDKSAAAAVVLTTAVSVLTPTAVARTAQVASFLPTLTDAQLTLEPGDTLEVKFVAAGSVSGSPTYCTFDVELLVQE